MYALQDACTEAARSGEPASPFHGRLVEAIRATLLDGVVEDGMVAALAGVAETDLTTLDRYVADAVPGRFSLTGGLDRRLLFAERPATLGGWVVADLSGQAHATRAWPDWVSGRADIAEPHGWLSVAELSGDAADRLARPRLLLTSLYHPEWFPLPRFALSISYATGERRRLTTTVGDHTASYCGCCQLAVRKCCASGSSLTLRCITTTMARSGSCSTSTNGFGWYR